MNNDLNIKNLYVFMPADHFFLENLLGFFAFSASKSSIRVDNFCTAASKSPINCKVFELIIGRSLFWVIALSTYDDDVFNNVSANDDDDEEEDDEDEDEDEEEAEAEDDEEDDEEEESSVLTLFPSMMIAK